MNATEIKLLLEKIEIRINKDWEYHLEDIEEGAEEIPFEQETPWQRKLEVEESNVLLLQCKEVITTLLNRNRMLETKFRLSKKEKRHGTEQNPEK